MSQATDWWARRTPVSTWQMYRSHGGHRCILCGLLIVDGLRADQTAPSNPSRTGSRRCRRAIFQVLPGAASIQRDVPPRRRVWTTAFRHAANADGADAGLRRLRRRRHPGRHRHRLPQAMGYQDVIRLLYGYSPARRCGGGHSRARDSKETPGLGDQDRDRPGRFWRTSVALDVVARPPTAAAIANPIESVKHGDQGPNRGRSTAITGATISSARRWPRMLQRQHGLLDPPHPQRAGRLRTGGVAVSALSARRTDRAQRHRRVHQGAVAGEPRLRAGARHVPGAGGDQLRRSTRWPWGWPARCSCC